MRKRAINIVDLFSGAGGLTFGFYYKKDMNKFVKNDKFNFLFANEYNKHAAAAFKLNFPNINLLECDIKEINKKKIKDNGIDISCVDLVIGGPPCQSYSTVGKRQYDNRAIMYKEYCRLLSILKPKMFIFENVKGLLTMKNNVGIPVIEDIYKMFNNIKNTNGYMIYKKILNAVSFGVPQNRERVFIVGVRKDVDLTWKFPDEILTDCNAFLSVENALSDLPPLGSNEEKNEYLTAPKNIYQELMRNNNDVLTCHKSGSYGKKIQGVINAVIEGEGREYINSLVDDKKLPSEYRLTSGYKNTYGRLWWNKPSTTITNNLGTPSSLRCIHPKENRALTTREGARLQSFPDFFKFYGGKTQQNSQVGNAVPPLLAISLANQVTKSFLSCKKKHKKG
ncbi:DNA cytosine methyltransferase [Campylobacter concisus]|uniref:DNA cytosine methyltransferase n=1 Tax=Campylobacter concisus TaxID=199 RepID=UPI0018C888FE|nr:DNA cytosine methyltransferase [Campylobacter concisus]